jgi:hypothetical protein
MHMEGQGVTIPDWVLQEVGRQHIETIMLRRAVEQLQAQLPQEPVTPHVVPPSEEA